MSKKRALHIDERAASGQQWGLNGNDVSFTWSRLKNDESNTSAI